VGGATRSYPGFLVFVIPLVIYVSGAALHFERGYYNRGLFAPHGLGSDDAYIGYRYGWNLAHYGHLSWNESQYRKTEGFTNPLWVLVSAGWSLLDDKDWLYPLTAATSVFMCASLLGLLISFVRAEGGRDVSALGPALAAASPVVWLHSTSGLESAVFGISLAALAYGALFGTAARPRPVVLFLLAVLPCLLRSDGFVYVAAVIAASVIAGSRSWRPAAAGLVLSSALLFGVRLFVFGRLLPNTAIAKLDFGPADRVPVGLAVLRDVVLHSGLGVLLALGLAGLALSGPRRLLAGAAVVLAWLGYFVYIGGDHFLERHLIGVLVFSTAVSGPVWRRVKTRYWAAGAAAACVLMFLPVFSGDERFSYTRSKDPDPWILLGKAMASGRPGFGVFVTEPAGKIPFFAGGDCIDALGLNDPDLARVKRKRFRPGHSAGSKAEALRIAGTHPCGTVSFFAYFARAEISGPEDIALWMNNRHPQDSVQTVVTREDWEAAAKAKDPFLWSVISRPR
jgi:hypothetical protein